jgi:ribosomal protein S27E
MPARYKFEYVKEYIENEGCELLSVEYKNSITKLKIKFQCGHIDENKTFSDFMAIERKICSDCSSNKFTYNYVKEYIESFGCELISDTYLGNNKKLKIKFTCGHVSEKTFEKFKLNNKVCGKCAGNYKHDEKNIILELKNSGLKLLNGYKNALSQMIVEDIDGYKYSTNLPCFREILNAHDGIYDAPIVSKYNPYSIYNISLWIKKNDLPHYLEEGQEYKNAKIKLKLICKTCDNHFQCCWDVISRKTGCPICAYTIGGTKHHNSNLVEKGSIVETHPEIALEWHLTKNEGKYPSQYTNGMDEKVWWVCPNGHEDYLAIISNRTLRNQGCPICKASHGEKAVHKFLTNNKLLFKPQKKFKDCKAKRCLPFDFYLTEENVAIEYNGLQHYQIIERWGGEPSFLKIQKYDQIKRDYCKNNNIKLIEIPYWDFDDIEKILTQELNLQIKEENLIV